MYPDVPAWEENGLGWDEGGLLASKIHRNKDKQNVRTLNSHYLFNFFFFFSPISALVDLPREKLKYFFL